MSLKRAAGLLALLAAGCGARTGLDQPPVDAAARPRFDAGTFTTFPCRWTLGVPTQLARGGPFDELAGAVHPTRDEAVVTATDASGGRIGARVSIAASGGVLDRLDDSPPGALFATASGYAVQPSGACMVDERDSVFAHVGDLEWGSSACWLTQSVVERLESVSTEGEVRVVTGLGATARATRVVATTAPIENEAFTFFERIERTTLLARQDGRSVVVERHLVAFDTVERFVVSTAAHDLSAAADPLRGGMMVHYRDATDGWRLEHFDWEAGRWPEAHFDVSDLPEPAGPIATNETEILMPLSDGRIAYVPFALVTLMVRWVDPVDGGAVERMRVFLRPNGSAGGVLFENRGALWFQPLVCNR